jgi:L-ascorbate metabolism protein UlaG (beta-lactamase superfamily)
MINGEVEERKREEVGMPVLETHDHNDNVFLKPMVKLEPLVCRWYAWVHLLSPVQMALHLTFRILPLLKSFATNATVHIAANADPKNYGGPFMDLKMSDLPEVKKLIEETNEKCTDLITLANDLRDLSEQLQEGANGYSLNEFYATLPESLKGLIEFLYDTNDQASIRLFEEFLYDEEAMGHTTEIMLQPIGEGDRPFFMSTPRLRSPESMSFKMKFDDRRLDMLSSMRTHAASFASVARQFEVTEQDMPTFRSFFTAEHPVSKGNQNFVEDGVRMRAFGHACVLLQTKNVSILFDPFVAIESGDDGRLTLNDLPEFIDFVVLTHSHQDHFCAEMLIQLRHRIGRIIVPANNSGAIADPSMKLSLMELGFTRIDTLSSCDRVDVPDGSILSLPFTGEHADLNVYSKHSIALTLLGRTFLFLIDSDGRDIALYKRMMRRIGDVDVLFIGMECQGAPLNWLYEPLLTKPVNRRNNESRRLCGADCERAWNIFGEVKPTSVFVYAMGQDPWMKYIMGLEYEPDSVQLMESNKFLELCTQANVAAERLVSGREVVYASRAAALTDVPGAEPFVAAA